MKAEPSGGGAPHAAKAGKLEETSAFGLAALGRMRVESIGVQILGAAVAGLAATWVLGVWAPVIWFASFLLVLLAERRLALRFAAAAAGGAHPPNMRAFAAWVFTHSAAGCALAPILWFGEPRHGDALAVFLLMAAAFHALLTLRGSGALLLCALAPVALYCIGLPLVEFLRHDTRALYADLAPVLAAAAVASFGHYAWRTLRGADAAAMQAERAAKEAMRARHRGRPPAPEHDIDAAPGEGAGAPARLALAAPSALAEQRALRPPALESVDPAALARAIVAEFRVEAERKGLALFLDAAEPLPARALLDASGLRRILRNLTSNAIRFTEKGAVRVCVRAQAGAAPASARLVFAVVDSGPGLSRAALGRALAEGRGLSAAARLARAMNARLSAKPAPAGGAIFLLALDAALTETAMTEAGAAPAAPALRVLVVEPLAHERRAIAEILDATALQYDMAESGARAREMIAARAYALVIVDHRDDAFDAIDAVELMRQGGPNAATPVIAVADADDKGAPAHCVECGVDGMASAPLAAGALLSEIARVLGAAPPAADWAA
ncbi:MAG: hybrid sensor histidine kinase/response regulator [Hyphomonadaceae bacterium]